MEAAATPFPREETTPPVTKIYFGPLRKFRKFLRSGVRTTHYEENRGACQIIRRDSLARRFLRFAALVKNFLHTRHIRRHIHAHRFVIHFDDSNTISIFEPAQLFELLDAFELARRKRGEIEQRLAAAGVESNVLGMAGGGGRGAGAHPRGQGERKKKRS